MIVFGTRPEAIKMCPLVLELMSRKSFEVVVCVTGQHRWMLEQVLGIFGVVPDYDFAVMREGQTLFDITTSIIARMKELLEKERPDIVLVHGDTTTAFSAAMAAFYMNIPVGHVEAGLRTYNIHAPYPEEFNRQAVDSISCYHFAPTETCRDNLIREGKTESSIYVTGNTVIDALKATITPDFRHPELDWAAGSRLIILTAHRRESFGEPLRRIFRAVRRILTEYRDVKVIYPIHMNPEVRRAAGELSDCDRLHIIEPLDVLDFHNFMARCYMILTDSGGVQEEAPALGRPVLVLRETTERPEGVEAGVLRLVGTDGEAIFRNAAELLESRAAYEEMARAVSPFGDGFASRRIADILER
ncbi:MAG TPA: UDP-N-acetylglucosamine 2-epimerase (non-hydrolyzing) [Clostridiales bacterium]|jgi:UDP-N-acetylglucosamine 2-epimerase (non-hydrolysing)|nr:UDP-N-acetylglucosamine 2-epimerase (non-hydrolyzing) [Clostridiales bacterium]